jgi:GTPase SAR1 family protein
MKSYVSNIGSRLINELRGLCDFPFEQRCGSLLRTVYPELISAPARSLWDRSGIDHFLLATDSDQPVSVFQCKGFAVGDFGAAQLEQCIDSIETFNTSTFTTKAYAIIVNRIVKGPQRAAIEAALQTLVDSRRAASASLLDLEAFLEAIFKQAQRELATLLRRSVIRFGDQHRDRMDETFYVPDVPFLLDSVRPHRKPLQHITASLLDVITARNNERSWIVLVGEFGFGKTSLALRLAQSLEQEEVICLYLPVAQFRANALDMEAPFLWQALEIVLQEELDRKEDRNVILHAALKEVFKREKRIVLIFDGIDEHPTCWRENGLMSVFGIFKTFNASCVFAVREEFLAERAGHFHTAIKGGPGCAMVRLIEWPEALVVDFAKRYQERLVCADARARIQHFADIVQTGQYLDYYGDIPKRPLFLKMLLEDVAKSDLRNCNIAELYGMYISKKFDSDRGTSTSHPVVRRPLSLDEDYEFVVRVCST